MRQSMYWDDFNRRVDETVTAIRSGSEPPVRRVAIFVTDFCNFNCQYCNGDRKGKHMSEAVFRDIMAKYGDTAILHITGGEPSIVPWLYPLLRQHGGKYRFHLNTNGFIEPPFNSVRRLKVSLDSCNPVYWDKLVGRRNAF